jgi:hypothetical protein
MTHSDYEILLSAYLDDEATGEERAQVERLLVESAEFRRLHKELVALRQRLQGLPKAKLDADFARRVVTMARLRAAEAEGINGSAQGGVSPASVSSSTGNTTDDLTSKERRKELQPGPGDDAPSPASISIHKNREKAPRWHWQLSAAAAAIALLVVTPIVLNNSGYLMVATSKVPQSKPAVADTAPLPRNMSRGSNIPPENAVENAPGHSAELEHPSVRYNELADPMGRRLSFDAAPKGDVTEVTRLRSQSVSDTDAERESYYLRAKTLGEAVQSIAANRNSLASVENERLYESQRELRVILGTPGDRLELDDKTHVEERLKAEDERKQQNSEFRKDTSQANRDMSDEKSLAQTKLQRENSDVEVWMATPLLGDSEPRLAQRFDKLHMSRALQSQSFEDQTSEDQTKENKASEGTPAGSGGGGKGTSENETNGQEPSPKRRSGTAGFKAQTKEAENGRAQIEAAQTDRANDFVPAQSASGTLANDATVDGLQRDQDLELQFLADEQADGATILLLDTHAPNAKELLETIQSKYKVSSFTLESPDTAGKREATKLYGDPAQLQFDLPNDVRDVEQPAAEEMEGAKSRSRAGIDKSGGEKSDSDKSGKDKSDNEKADRPQSATVEEPAQLSSNPTPPSPAPPSPTPPSRSVAVDNEVDELRVKSGDEADAEPKDNKAQEGAPSGALAKTLEAKNGQLMSEFGFGSQPESDHYAYVWEFRWRRVPQGEEIREHAEKLGQSEIASAAIPAASDSPASKEEDLSDENSADVDTKKEAGNASSKAPLASKKISPKNASGGGLEVPADSAVDGSMPEGQVKGKEEAPPEKPALAGKPTVADPEAAGSKLSKADDRSAQLPPAPAGPGSLPPALRPKAETPRESGEKLAESNRPMNKASKETEPKADAAASVEKGLALEREESTTRRAKDQRGDAQSQRFGAQTAPRPRWLVIVVPNVGRERTDVLSRDSAKAKIGAEAAESKEPPAAKAEPASEPAPASKK